MRVKQRRLALCLAGAVVLGGCGAQGVRAAEGPRPTLRASWASAGIQDQRQAFAAVFCRKLRELSGPRADCGRWHWGAPAGPVADAMPSAPALRLPRHRTLVIVPGIFGECVAPWVTPFSRDYAALEALGYRVKVLPLEGRGSAELNAAIIHRQLSDPALGLENAVVIAYSKGLTDFMLAASQPAAAAWRDDVEVLVSVAGTANGSPVANRGATLYERLLARLPLKHCGPSDGGGARSLTYARAMAVAEGFAAAKPPFASYSVVAVARKGKVNPALAGSYRLLARIDERNDGQVLLEDAVVPGSTVLGVFRADHWSIALPFEESDALAVALLRRNNSFPRGALVRALLEFTAPVAAAGAPLPEAGLRSPVLPAAAGRIRP